MSDAIRELLDLAAVHSFYKSLLENYLGHAVPAPVEKMPVGAGNAVEHSTAVLKRWLRVLDMAISPPMVRDALPDLSGHETREALLRYYVLKASIQDVDRDKTDFVATYLYRTPLPGSKRTGKFLRSAAHDAYYFFAQQAMEFETELLAMFGDAPQPPLPEEHRQLLREFEFIYSEVEEIRTFDQLMDSGIMAKVREVKRAFGKSFYHPDVLALLAAYNVYFGSRFDELFREATQQIKSFAEKVQQEGGSIMSRVDGDVIVKHLTEVEENKLLRTEYHRAQEQFRNVSKLKKAVDSRKSRTAPPPPPPPPPVVTPPETSPASARDGAASAAHRRNIAEPLAESVVIGRGMGSTLEDTKVSGMIETIRNFVRAADPRAANVVPLRDGNITLAPVELEAFRADYHQEKSFRGEYAAIVCELVAIHTRLTTELAEFKAKQNSAYLWKPHADAMTFLLSASTRSISEASRILQLAEQRGLADKVKGLNSTTQKLQQLAQHAARVLQSINTGPGMY